MTNPDLPSARALADYFLEAEKREIKRLYPEGYQEHGASHEIGKTTPRWNLPGRLSDSIIVMASSIATLSKLSLPYDLCISMAQRERFRSAILPAKNNGSPVDTSSLMELSFSLGYEPCPLERAGILESYTKVAKEKKMAMCPEQEWDRSPTCSGSWALNQTIGKLRHQGYHRSAGRRKIADASKERPGRFGRRLREAGRTTKGLPGRPARRTIKADHGSVALVPPPGNGRRRWRCSRGAPGS